MPLNFRQTEILDILRSENRVTVEDLAARFDVTLQTIRRDLGDLADARQVQRVHGGAVLPSSVRNIGYQDRRELNAKAKAAIAALCADQIPDNASLFLNIGTTTEAVARALLDHRDIMVVTNNMNVANILVENPHCEVIVAGGILRRTDGGLVGDLAAQTIEQFKVDFAVIGASALDADGDLTDFDVQEVRVAKAIIHQARSVILVADHTKFQRSAPVRIGSLEEIDMVITDHPFRDALARKCKDWETRVLAVST